MNDFFAYGSLMCQDIMAQVSGVLLSAVPAVLQEFSRRSIRGEDYPAIIPQAGARVEGVCYRSVPGPAWQRLDRFEGEMYARQIVKIECGDGTRLDAVAYVLQPAFLNLLEPTQWDFNAFLRAGKARFQRRYKGYEAI